MVNKSVIVITLLLCLGAVSSAYVGQHHSHGARKTPGRVELPLKSFEIPDSLFVDQNEKRVKFYSDLVKGKVVVINFFFTTCRDVCPMQGRAMTKLKTSLGERLGRDVFFISVSKDPANDTPERLTQWARNYGVGSGWTLLTGDASVIEKLLWDFSGERLGQEMHESLVIIGNDRTGVWTSADGLLLTEDLVKAIDGVARVEH